MREWGAHNAPTQDPVTLPSLPGDSREVANQDVYAGAHSWNAGQTAVINTPTWSWKAVPKEERTKQDKNLCLLSLPWIKVYGVNARRAGICQVHA